MTKTFDELFTDFYPVIQKMARSFANKTPIPAEEFESQFCETFFTQFETYDHTRGNFSAFMRVVLQQEGVRLSSRKERRFYDSIEYLDTPDAEDDDAKYPLELVADVDIEEQVFDVMFIEEQLAKADDVTRKVLEAFFADPHASYRDIARTTGISRPTVTRRLESVAKAVRGT